MEHYEYLAHHGVKGMKWGVRKYQNPDGSLTPAGEKKYATKAARQYYKAERNKIRKEHAHTFETYKRSGKKVRKAEGKMNRLQSGVSKTALDAGRRRVAKSRALKFGAASVASTAATAAGVAAIASNPILGLSVVTIGAVAGTKSIGRTAYYTRENHSYKRSGE